MNNKIKTKEQTYELLVSTIKGSRNWVKYKDIVIELGDELELEEMSYHLDSALNNGDLVIPSLGRVCSPEYVGLYAHCGEQEELYDDNIPF